MNWKRIGNALLFPPAAVLIVLTPIAAAALVYSMLRLEETSPVRIGSYVLAFYTLVIVCVRVPKVARSIGTFKRENKYIQFWSNDPRLRMNITVGGVCCGTALTRLCSLDLPFITGLRGSILWQLTMRRLQPCAVLLYGIRCATPPANKCGRS